MKIPITIEIDEDVLRSLLQQPVTSKMSFTSPTVLCDTFGRIIPTNLKEEVVDANNDFYLEQPKNSVKTAWENIKASQFKNIPSLKEFENRIETLKQKPEVQSLQNGVCFPIMLPQFTVKDYGTDLENTFIPAVEKAYKQAFPDRNFYNWRKNDLAKKVSIVDPRHEALIEHMKIEWVIGLYFPTPLQGYSIPAAREMVEKLPEGFSLAGPIDSAMALIAFPEVLCRDFKTPILDCAAVSWQSGDSLCWDASDGELRFSRRYLGAGGRASAGLLFVG